MVSQLTGMYLLYLSRFGLNDGDLKVLLEQGRGSAPCCLGGLGGHNGVSCRFHFLMIPYYIPGRMSNEYVLYPRKDENVLYPRKDEYVFYPRKDEYVIHPRKDEYVIYPRKDEYL